MALIEITPMHGSGKRGSSTDFYYVGISTTKNSTTKSDGKARQTTTFKLTAKSMTDLRWVVGDRLKIFLDSETNEVHLRRAAPGSDNSFTLSATNIAAKEAIGKKLPCTIRTCDARLPHVSMTHLQKEDCYIAENGDLVFVYPVPLNLPQSAKQPPVVQEIAPVTYHEAVKNLDRRFKNNRAAR